jgi:hypothetical protein
MQGFENNVAYFQGIDTRGVRPVANQMTVDGQLLIGSSTSPNIGAATLTAGTGISITNGHNSITINAVGEGVTWSVVTGASQSMASNHGYIANNAGTINFSLPGTSSIGDIISITGINNATGWQITQALGQQIFYGKSSTTSGAGGSLTSSATRDTITMVCTAANTTWQIISSIGNITVV